MLDALRRELHEEHGVVLSPSVHGMSEIVYRQEIMSTRSGDMTQVHCFAVPAECVDGVYQCGDNVAGFGWYSWEELSVANLTPADSANRDRLLYLIR